MMIRAWSLDRRKTKDEVYARQSREAYRTEEDISGDLSSLFARRICIQHPFHKRLSLSAIGDQKGWLYVSSAEFFINGQTRSGGVAEHRFIPRLV